MADENKLIVEIELDDGSIKKGFIQLENQAKSTGKKIGDSFDKDGSGVSTLSKSFIGLKTVLAGVAAAAGSLFVLSKGIREAVKEQEAVNQLNSALQLTGKFTQETSNQLQTFADQVEKATRFEKELILETAGLIQVLGNLESDALQRSTKAALDFAQATGKDARTAAELLGKAAQGNVTAFQRYGIEVRKGATDAQTFENALTELEKKFGGSSELALNTFGGATQALTRSFGDFLKIIGQAVIQSPVITTLIKTLNSVFIDLGKTLENFFAGKDFFGDLAKSITNIVLVLSQTALPVFEVFFNILSVGFNTVGQTIAVFVSSFVTGIEAAKKALTGDFAAAFELLKTIGTNTGEVILNTFDSIANVASTDFSQGVVSQLERIDQALKTVKENAAVPIPTPKIEAPGGEGGDTGDAFSSFFDGFTMRAENAQQKLAELDKNFKERFKAMGDAARDGLARGAGNAFAAFGAALVKGENALEAFGKAFLASVGQEAVALGTKFILEGVAYSVLGDPRGSGLIAAGAALAAFGGALSAVSGGNAGGAGSASSGGATSVEPVDSGAGGIDFEEQGPKNEITINVDNSIVDADLPTRIAGLVQEAIDRNGTSILQVS